jgi:hypothetical protein
LKIKHIIPVSIGLAAVLCLNLVRRIQTNADVPVPETIPEVWSLAEPLNGAYTAVLLESAEQTDKILECYRNSFLQNGVIAFFGAIVHSEELAAVMLNNAAAFDIAPALAFALSWEESQYTIRAVNRKNSNNTVDRGLFQLNCCSFPDLNEADFFNPHLNAYYAMAHLRWCLNTGGSEVAALAMYNAGTARVRAGETPKKTLDYVSRILRYRQRVEDLFQTECLGQWDIPAALALEREKEALPPDDNPSAQIAGAAGQQAAR